MKWCGIILDQALLSKISLSFNCHCLVLFEFGWSNLYWGNCRLNEEMIETLFVVNTPNTKSNQTTPRTVLPSPNQENRVLDPKKAQNIAILLRALNVTIEEVCEALLEGIISLSSSH